jgi:hypothetical protein
MAARKMIKTQQPKLSIMRVIVLLISFFLFTNVHSQVREQMFLDSTLTQLKKQTTIEKNDLKVFSLLQRFYNEVLQSDKGELSPQTAQMINTYAEDKKTSNKHLLILFLMYQQHISETAAQGKNPNAAFQLACMNLLEKEFLSVYQKVPTIVYIYKAEALQSAGHNGEAKSVIETSLQKDPVSIPLKVYRYLDTKDEALKKDLVTNHSGHWMVQQFGIK